jgi:predicted permease
MADIVGLVLPFFGLILVGYIAAKITRQPAEALGWLNTFIIYVSMPALFIKLISKTPVEELARFDFIAADLAATYTVFVLLYIVGRRLCGNTIADSTMQALAGCYGNIGYMGPGLALLAFGEKAAVPLALIFCFESALHFTVAPAMMALAGDDDRPAGLVGLEILRKIALHPFMISTAIGIVMAVFAFQTPAPLQRFVDYLAQASAPCALFAMGVSLALRPLKRIPAEIGYIVPAKLLLHPLLVYVVLSAVGNFDPLWLHTAVLLAALPTATSVFVIGQQYGVWQERASATVLITTVLSVLTVSSLLYAITTGMLPADLFP